MRISPDLCERDYMKKIIVTGCNGQLGRAVNEYYKDSSEYTLVNTDVGIEGENLDITDIDAVDAFFDKVKPYAVRHLPMWTAVRQMRIRHLK